MLLKFLLPKAYATPSGGGGGKGKKTSGKPKRPARGNVTTGVQSPKGRRPGGGNVKGVQNRVVPRRPARGNV